MKDIIITLDGYSSCGKSTLARQLASELNYVFIDSGAMYRAITLYFLRLRINLADEKLIHQTLGEINLSFQYNEITGNSDMFLNDENVETFIRDMLVSEHVSEVSALQPIREFAVAQQQAMGRQKRIVMDGRDIGTTVFPNAELKVFVTADPAVRVERRYKEMYSKNQSITIEEVKANIEMRDYTDSHREFSPLRKAAEAIELDNSNLTREEQLSIVLQWAKEKIA